MAVRYIERSPVEPILDFEQNDLREPQRPWDTPFPPFPSRIVEGINAIFAIGDIVRAVHGDQLTVPQELHGPGHEEDIATMLARRFDPYSNLVKSRIYKNERKGRLGRSVEWGLTAAAVLGIEVSLAASFNIVEALGLGTVEGILLDRTYVNVVEAIIAGDRSHDERERIDMQWFAHLNSQINEAIQQAEIGDNAEAAMLLRNRAIQLVVERHQAFNARFNTSRGKRQLRDAITDAVNLHDTQATFDRYMDHLARGGKVDSRRGRVRDILVYEKRRAIAYRPDLKRYVSLAQLDKEREQAAKQQQIAARRAQSSQKSPKWWPFGR